MNPKDLKGGERYQDKYGTGYTYQGFDGDSYVFIGFAGHLSKFDESEVAELEWQSEEAVDVDDALGEPGDGSIKGA